MAFILGINCVYHESSACILQDGRVVAFIEEERLNRVKHAKPALITNPADLPLGAIEYCLKETGIGFGDIDRIGFSIDPEARYTSNVDADPYSRETGVRWGTREGEHFFREKTLEVVPKLSELFGRDVRSCFSFVPHHVCHAFSTFCQSGYGDAAVVVVDGIGEGAATWVGKGSGNGVERLYEVPYPNSLGFLWEKMSEFLGFDEYAAAKVMGLSSYGDVPHVADGEDLTTLSRFRSNDRRLQELWELVKRNGDGTFLVDNSVLRFRTNDFSAIEKHFGVKKREPQTGISRDHEEIACALQDVTEEVILHIAGEAKNRTGSRNLCMSGGVALNCVANARVIRSGIFENVYIEPAANDAGTALGAAIYVWCGEMGRPKSAWPQTAFLGPEFSNDEILNALKSSGLGYERVDDIEVRVARLLVEGKVVPWFQCRMEIGPRALGHRSILADPRDPQMRDRLNREVKYREYFRPYCPSVLAEYAAEWFELGGRLQPPMNYMLAALDVKPDKKPLIPAVIHVDGTARIQSVRKNDCPRYWRLIDEFRKLTGIPMVLNTSFNIQEPIVCSPTDAIRTFRRSPLQCLAIGDYLVIKAKWRDRW